jgi:hypothetical protein
MVEKNKRRLSMKNGRDIGKENLAVLQEFVRSGQPIPLGRDGKLNLAELSRITEISKSSFYQNPAMRLVINTLRGASGNEPDARKDGGTQKYVDEVKVARDEARQLQQLERKLHALEQRVAVLAAENSMLRKQLIASNQQLARQDMMIDSGKRILPFDADIE